MIFILFCFTVALQGFFARLDVADFPHEGVLLKPAIDLLEGKMLFRDSYSQYGAVPILLQAAAVKLFGRYLLVPKLLTVFVYGLIAILLFLLGRRFVPEPLAFFSVILWNLFTHHFYECLLPWSSVYALFFQLMSAACLFLFFDRQKIYFIFLTGAFSALSFLSKLNVGMFTFISELLFFVMLWRLPKKNGFSWNVWKNLAWLAGGFGVIFSIFVAWIGLNGALANWWLQGVVWPYYFAKFYGKSYEIRAIISFLFLGTQRKDTDFMFILMPLAVLVVMGHRFFKGCRKGLDSQDASLLGLGMVCLAAWLQYFPMQARCYFWWGSSPMVIFFALAVHDGFGLLFNKKKKSWTTAATLAMLAVLSAYPIFMRFQALRERLKDSHAQIPRPSFFSGIWLSKSNLEYVREVEKAIDTDINARANHPDVILDGMDAAALCMVKNARNFHPMWESYEPAWSVIYPDYETKVNRRIMEHRPVILTNAARLTRFKLFYPETYRFIRAHYVLTSNVQNRFIVLLPKQ